MNRDIVLPLGHRADPPPVRECHLTLARKTTEDSNDVLGCFVSLIYNDYSAIGDGAQ